MEKLIYFLVHLIVPAIIVLLIIKIRPKSKLNLVVTSGLYFSVICFLYLWGQWPLVGSYYLRYLLIGIGFLIIIYLIHGFRTDMGIWPNKLIKYVLIIPIGLLSMLFLSLSVRLYNGRTYAEDGVSLKFPLKNGKYYIASGGSNSITNNHIRDYPNSQQFALDINKLGKYGGAYKSIFSDRNEDHYIYSDTVYCPCNGVLTKYSNNVEDNSNSSMDVDSKNGKGNFVTIDCDGVFVSLYHLKKNSVINSDDNQVTEGMPLGLVGNSGFSQEPHLHIQAAVYNRDSVLVGVPMKFRDRYLSRNNVVSLSRRSL